MNRIQHSSQLTKPSPASSTFNLESALFVPPTHDSSRALFGPLHYEPKYAYPLIVWLHSPGCDERELVRTMPLISTRNYVAVAPRGFRLGGGGSDREGYGWPQTQDHIQEAEWRIFESIEVARQKFRCAKGRVFLAGFDAGGTMAFRAGMNHPGRFAGVLSLCGAFPCGHTPFSHLNEARGLPLFLAVGHDSRRYPPDKACEHLRLFHAAGMSVALRQYSCGHDLTEQMLRDVDRWIIEQITAPGDPLSEPDNRWWCPLD